MKTITFVLSALCLFILNACGPQAKSSAVVAASQPTENAPQPAPSPTPAPAPFEPVAAPAPPAPTPSTPTTPTEPTTVVAPTPPVVTPQQPAPVTPAPRTPSRAHPPQNPPQRPANQTNSEFANKVRRVTLTVNDRNLAEKVLFKKSETISGALADGQFLAKEKVVDALKKAKTICVFVSENNNFPNKGETLKSVKIVERLSLTRANLPLRQIEAVFTAKDQFYSLHCEKKGTFKTLDVTKSLGSAFDVQFLMQ